MRPSGGGNPRMNIGIQEKPKGGTVNFAAETRGKEAARKDQGKWTKGGQKRTSPISGREKEEALRSPLRNAGGKEQERSTPEIAFLRNITKFQWLVDFLDEERGISCYAANTASNLKGENETTTPVTKGGGGGSKPG